MAVQIYVGGQYNLSVLNVQVTHYAKVPTWRFITNNDEYCLNFYFRMKLEERCLMYYISSPFTRHLLCLRSREGPGNTKTDKLQDPRNSE